MPYVIIDRESGIRSRGHNLKPGANWVDDSETGLLDWLEKHSFKGVEIRQDRDQPKPDTPPEPEPEPEAPEEPYERFLARDGKWYYYRPAGAGRPMEQSEGFASTRAVEEAIEEDKAESERIALAEDVDTSVESGPLIPDELTDSTFECHDEDCTKEFKSTGARKNHERIFHRHLFRRPDEADES